MVDIVGAIVDPDTKILIVAISDGTMAMLGPHTGADIAWEDQSTSIDLNRTV
jgi:hypothetical protein